MSSTTQNVKIGPCSITYKGELLGITRNSSTLSFKFSHYDVKCNRTHEQIIDKRLTGIHIYFKTEILQIDTGIKHLFNGNTTWTMDYLGKRWSLEGGELLIVPISTNDKIAYRMPNALIVNQGTLTFNNNSEYTLQLEFESNYNDGEEILIETLDADTCERASLEDSSIDSDSFEFAMTAYIAAKLGMTVDTDIFRGGIPVNVDGCGVELVGYEEDDSMTSAKYFISFFCLDPSRKKVMKNIKSLADKFPVYGETITLEGVGDVTCLAITKITVKFSKETTDNGRIKNFGELLLKVSI
ncbi:MAG: hypothetical protein PHH77_09240 [Victivallaceae bacterium]|nr:hypothetical protein [Victivallaceae bacterium]